MTRPRTSPAAQDAAGETVSPAREGDPWAQLARPPASAAAGWALLLDIARALPASYPPVVHGMLTEPEVEAPLVTLCRGVRDVR